MAQEPRAAPSVWTLLVQLGRAEGDGLPDGATGAALLCYASGRSEKNAVDETVAVLRQADLSPLEVESLGTVEERRQAGDEIGAEDLALMQRALDEQAVIVAQTEVFYD
ncbi:MAG TPA: hypothetical protein VFJ13_05540 [Paracoccaceae bacterium]|nr:hypothetical protein [Paracoccaceae bacterium]